MENKERDINYWMGESDKCMADPFYFFSNYCSIDGEKPKMTREEYFELLVYFKNKSPLKYRKNYKH